MTTPVTLQARCLRCDGRGLSVPGPDASLVVTRDDDGDRVAFVSFSCPEGHAVEIRVWKPELIDTLLGSNLIILSAPPPEYFDPARISPRPVFTLDDLLDLHQALEGTPTADAQ